MRSDKYLNSFWNIVKENNILKMTLITFVLITVIEGFFTIYALNTQRTIIIPSVKGKYVIEQNKANRDYLINMGIFLSDMMENFTPKTIKGNYQRFLDFVSPEHYGKVQAVLTANAQDFISTDTSSWLIIKNIKLYPNNTIIITGNRKLLVSDKVVSAKYLKVVIVYVIKNGKFEVVSYAEKNSNHVH